MTRFRFTRWWGLGGGALLAIVDTATLPALGVRLEVNGGNATVLVGAFFGSSIALLGFLVGYVIEGRRRDREAQAVIRAQSETLATTRARLAQSEKLAALGQLATAIAHEVRNPLAVIRSAAQGFAEAAAPGDAEAERASSFITAEIDRLSSVVTSLLAFARPPQLERRVVPIGDVLDRALLLASGDLGARGVHLRRGQVPASAAVAADPDLLCQVLLGLLSNAAEATGPGGDVWLEVEAAGAGVELAVADSGPGVPIEMRARIFEPFFTTRARGTGLGLAVARQIVEAHGGRIDVGDRPGGGARFTIWLPPAEAKAAA
jgi:signal transduction histidine kinase